MKWERVAEGNSYSFNGCRLAHATLRAWLPISASRVLRNCSSCSIVVESDASDASGPAEVPDAGLVDGLDDASTSVPGGPA